MSLCSMKLLYYIIKIKEIYVKVGCSCCFAVDRLGRGGGLAVFLSNSSTCNVVNYSQNHINLSIYDHERGVCIG